MVGRAALERFLDGLPGHVLPVLDEAYFEYVDDPEYPDGASEQLARGRRCVVLRTFSKIYGLAGFRVGYGLCPPDVAAACLKVKNAFDVTQSALDAALASLGAGEEVARRRDETRGRAASGSRRACGSADSQPLEGVANFLCVDVGDAAAFAARLERQGVIVRPLGAVRRSGLGAHQRRLARGADAPLRSHRRERLIETRSGIDLRTASTESRRTLRVKWGAESSVQPSSRTLVVTAVARRGGGGCSAASAARAAPSGRWTPSESAPPPPPASPLRLRRPGRPRRRPHRRLRARCHRRPRRPPPPPAPPPPPPAVSAAPRRAAARPPDATGTLSDFQIDLAPTARGGGCDAALPRRQHAGEHDPQPLAAATRGNVEALRHARISPQARRRRSSSRTCRPAATSSTARSTRRRCTNADGQLTAHPGRAGRRRPPLDPAGRSMCEASSTAPRASASREQRGTRRQGDLGFAGRRGRPTRGARRGCGGGSHPRGAGARPRRPRPRARCARRSGRGASGPARPAATSAPSGTSRARPRRAACAGCAARPERPLLGVPPPVELEVGHAHGRRREGGRDLLGPRARRRRRRSGRNRGA